MRTLFYVPIIHTGPDLGSLSEEVNKRGIKELGEKVWKEHLSTVDAFWKMIADYFNRIDAMGVKIYQDGMVGEDEVGKEIVETGAKCGSKNHELVLNLMKRGAVLVKTEDFKLVKKERDRLVAIIQAKSIIQKLIAFIKYILVKNRLLNQRDEFIAKRINETLGHHEAAILFIGAYHNIKGRLFKDILIKQVKDIQKVKEYQNLLPFYHKKKKQLEELGKYLISKVVI